MLTLIGIGWKVDKMDKLVDRSWQVHNWKRHNGQKSTRRSLDAVELDAGRIAWLKAAAHKHGRGLEAGPPSMKPTSAARRWLIKHEMWNEAKALDALVTGNTWAGPVDVCICGAPCTAEHKYWTCPRLRATYKDVVNKAPTG